MIPIAYPKDKTKLKFYDDYIIEFKSKMQQWLDKGFVGNKKKSKATWNYLNEGTKDFWQWLLKEGHLDKIIYCSPEDLYSIGNNILGLYKQLNDHSSKMYKLTKYAFVDWGYKNFPAYKLIEALDVDVCPYCNRTFIRTIYDDNGKGIVRGQLDHFYPKEKYPFLAIAKYNLVPCCSSCNGGGSKHSKDPYEIGLINPYQLKNPFGLKFSMEISGSGFLSMETCARAISIDVKEQQNSGLNANIEAFHLKEIYNTHTDYAADIYYKGKLKYNKTYRNQIIQLLSNKGLHMSEDDFDRLMLGFHTDPSKFNKQPLSKFRYDLANDEKVRLI